MANDFLAEGYFDDELDFLSKSVYDRMLYKLIDTVRAIEPSPSASSYAVKRLARALLNCEDTYHMMKLLLMAHILIDRLQVGRLYLLEVISELKPSWLRPKCKFDKHLTNTLLKDYINYLMKMCSACQMYSHCLTTYRSEFQPNDFSYNEDSLHLYFHGALNITQCCWPLLEHFRRLERILPETYPFLLDIYALVGKETYSFVRAIHSLYDRMAKSSLPANQVARECTSKELMRLQDNIQDVSSSEFLAGQLQEHAPSEPDCISHLYHEDIRVFMSSQSKHLSQIQEVVSSFQ